jgi:hypothetical protein
MVSSYLCQSRYQCTEDNREGVQAAYIGKKQLVIPINKPWGVPGFVDVKPSDAV